MELSIDAVVASKIGFASHQNAIPVIRELKIHAKGEAPLEYCTLTLQSDPPFLQSKTWRFERILGLDELFVADRDVQLNATLLSGLSESLVGTLTFNLVAQDGTELARATYPVELLAHNEWGGLSAMAELLPAFTMPNDPAVDRVLKAASEALRRAGKLGDLDGYKSKDRSRVWEIASAVWSAISGLRLSYAIPPASFERIGQKVRTPSAILDGGIATCLDSALLFAAALEQAGLNPLLVLTQGHAFAGVWLQPMEFSNLLTDEAAALRRRIDLDDLLLFETTLVTNNPPLSFSNAISAARNQIAEDSISAFEMAIDIRRARMQRIRPLAVALQGSGGGDVSVSISEGVEAAPSLPTFDVEVEDVPATPADRIRQWQRKLLNLTTSNRLLHLPDSAKVLRLQCPDPGALEDLLASGKRVRITAMPEVDIGGRDETLYSQRTQKSLRDEIAQEALARGEALSTLSKDKLDAVVVELYRKARNDIEEGGANTLYLTLGFLKWKKSKTEEKTYSAPLILVPVKLERKSALSGVVMTHHEDDVQFNLTLLEMLKQDFELIIPGLDGELPKDEHGVDVDGIWRMIRSAVRDMPGFEVVSDVVLGTFSFAKYLMWKDLVDRTDRLKESPLVRHLIERDGSALAGRTDFPKPDELDATVDPSRLFTPLPADSSQVSAIVASERGHTFVLDGPPGCGKSQTIANMIAHNLALGRRVLFVAEKKAALDVVQRRLSDRGLAPFCLELHSAKATKSAVLKQLDQAWSTREALSADDWAREAAEARSLRDSLNEVVHLLNRRESNGWTIQKAIGLVVRDGPENAPRLTFSGETKHSAADMSRLRDAARRLGLSRAEVNDIPAELNGIATTEWSNSWQQEIVALAGIIPSLLDAVGRAAEGLQASTSLPFAMTNRAEVGRSLDFTQMLLEMHGRDMRVAFSSMFQDQVVAAREALRLIHEYTAEETALSARYAQEAVRRIDVAGTEIAWKAACERYWPLSFFGKRKVIRLLTQAAGASGDVSPEADIPRLARMRDLLARIDFLAQKLTAFPGWCGLATDPKQVESTISRAETLRSSIAAEAKSPENLAALRNAVSSLVVDANELLAADGQISGAAARLAQVLATYDSSVVKFEHLSNTRDDPNFVVLRARAGAIVASSSRLRDWANWCRMRNEAIAADLDPLVRALDSQQVSPHKTTQAFELAYAYWFAFTRIDQEPVLKTFAANEQMDRIERFRLVEDRMQSLASRYIRAKICGLIPDKDSVSKKDGYGILKHQLQLQRAHKPIRQLATDMGDAFTRLAPCMLMSPLSIAQYLPSDYALFDLVIFDEASQITPWDAIGAMARGKQVVIAGDPRQMPPSNDFQRGPGNATITDDEGVEPDLESILEECLAAGVPTHSLDWHYRSRHESLIAFSNHRYYDGRLVTFPAPETRPSAVSWVRVPGTWARGAERTNQIEAKAIVEEAVRRLRDPKFIGSSGTPLSLGIITMNIEQMRLVEDLLDRARRAYPEIESHFADEQIEPVVVRNLETAQGDERDVILLGVGFGPTEPDGKSMSMNFGKLNAQGGWRRLNVAITRARAEMRVFTSFDPGMIDLTRTSQQAVSDLKNFIEYAHRGPRAIAEAARGSIGTADSPFEEAVTFELRRRGWTVVPQVGVSRFRIDLGIVHPDRPGDYLVGIECDGASYHSAATARDRDKIRAAILENLGWRLLRVWSTDWWTDKERAANKLHNAMQVVLEEDRANREALEGVVLTERFKQEDSSVFANKMGETASEALSRHSHPDEPPPAAYLKAPTIQHTPDAQSAEPDRHLYRMADLSTFSESIDPARFYEPEYDPTLTAIIAHVLKTEAPIAETQLVQRIARAHGFQRAGRIIRERVIDLVRQLHHFASDGGSELFVWFDAKEAAAGVAARLPAGEEHIRAIEDISMAELRATGSTDPVEVARLFGLRRLSATARARIERAISPMQKGFDE